MYSVVIVDDEKKIVEMIRHLIDWESLGFQVIGVAYNGPEAFKLIDTVHPDVVIADIRMPGFDGLELIKKCHSERIYPDFIIVSGYRLFEYAHNAIQYGVEYYLLKPLDKEELIKALSAIAIKKKEIFETAEEIENNNRHNDRVNTFLHSCLNGTLKEKSLADLSESLGVEFDYGEGAVFQFLYYRIYNKSAAKFRNDQLMYDMQTAMGEALENNGCLHLETIHLNGILSLLYYRTDGTAKIHKCGRELTEKLNSVTDKFGAFFPVLGISSTSCLVTDLMRLAEEAVEATCYVLVTSNDIFDFTDYSYQNIPIGRIYTPDFSKRFIEAMSAGEIEQVRRLYTSAVNQINAIGNPSPTMYCKLIEAIVTSIKSYIGNARLDRFELDEKLDLIIELLNVRCWKGELIESALHLLQEISGIIARQYYMEYSKPIRKVREYIDEHYTENISLNEMADMVDLSPSYLSAVFKKELGIGFSDYIISCRISAAKKMLIETDMRLTEIAEAVGYNDSKHFGKLFRNITGLKPKDFKKLYS